MQDDSGGHRCCERRPLVAVCTKSEAGALDFASSESWARRLPRLAAGHRPRPPFATTAVSKLLSHAPETSTGCPWCMISVCFTPRARPPPSPSRAQHWTSTTPASNNAAQRPGDVGKRLGSVRCTYPDVLGWNWRDISAQRRTWTQVRCRHLRLTTYSPARLSTAATSHMKMNRDYRTPK